MFVTHGLCLGICALVGQVFVLFSQVVWESMTVCRSAMGNVHMVTTPHWLRMYESIMCLLQEMDEDSTWAT